MSSNYSTDSGAMNGDSSPSTPSSTSSTSSSGADGNAGAAAEASLHGFSHIPEGPMVITPEGIRGPDRTVTTRTTDARGYEHLSTTSYLNLDNYGTNPTNARVARNSSSSTSHSSTATQGGVQGPGGVGIRDSTDTAPTSRPQPSQGSGSTPRMMSTSGSHTINYFGDTSESIRVGDMRGRHISLGLNGVQIDGQPAKNFAEDNPSSGSGQAPSDASRGRNVRGSDFRGSTFDMSRK